MANKNRKNFKTTEGKGVTRANSNRGRKFSNNSESKDACPKCGYSSNNPAWYTGNPIAAKKAGSINFSYPIGYDINLDNPLHTELTDKGSFAFPGMMALSVLPALGQSLDASSALNLAAFKLYSFIRHENSGSRNYDAPDLLLYVAAVTDVYSYITWLQRTYLVCNSYSVMNEYIPRAYCHLSNIDFDDIVANLADFAYQLDNRINKVRSFKVPGDMPIFQRRAFMFKDLYTEGESIKDQMYFYTPGGFYTFDLDPDGAGRLQTRQMFQIMLDAAGNQYGPYKVKDLFAGLDFLISKIAEQEDFGIMSGDILKAYGANIVTLAPFDPAPGMGIVPVRDIAVLEQIQNSTVVSWSTLDDNMAQVRVATDVYQSPNKNYLLSDVNYQFTAPATPESRIECYSKQGYAENRILTSRNLDPTPEQVLESTRNMVIASKAERETNQDTITVTLELLCGTELINDCTVCFYEMQADGTRKFKTFRVPYILAVDLDATDKYEELPASYWMLTLLSQFDYHPCVRLQCAKHSTTTEGAVNWLKAYTAFNTSEYTIVTKDMLRRMHDTALMSLLHV